MPTNRSTPLSPYTNAPKWRRRRPGKPSLALATGLPLAMLGAFSLTGGGHHNAAAAAGTVPVAYASHVDQASVKLLDAVRISDQPAKPAPPAPHVTRTVVQPNADARPVVRNVPITPRPAPRPAAATAPVPATQVAKPVIGPNGESLGIFVITCYDLQGRTATGTTVSTSTVAVDPSVIPLGSRIYIEGVGTRIAQDTGGAIVGHRLDIWEPTYSACAAWGVESRQVWLES